MEGIRAWVKQFYVLAPCCIDFMSHFFIGWSVNVDFASKHDVMIMLYCIYLWSQDRDNGRLWTSLTVQHRITD